ncbi:MAG TPA: hypothetical protein VKU00_09945 [Chthonomonadaceae bacterium]|nr:hypothetical protein [Chthonomonadaceae bacterium]
MSTPPSLKVLWANCVDRLKDRVNNRSFWEAIEKTQAILIENGVLVIGLAPEDYNRASHIQQTATMHTVTSVVQEQLRQPLQVRLIEGTTLADWEALMEREARVTAMRQAAVIPRPVSTDGASDTWEALYDQMARLYAQTPFRSLPQGKARYANEALYLLAEAMDWLYAETPDDHMERSLARVLERIANASEIPASALAFELERLRAWRRASAEQPA